MKEWKMRLLHIKIDSRNQSYSKEMFFKTIESSRSSEFIKGYTFLGKKFTYHFPVKRAQIPFFAKPLTVDTYPLLVKLKVRLDLTTQDQETYKEYELKRMEVHRKRAEEIDMPIEEYEKRYGYFINGDYTSQTYYLYFTISKIPDDSEKIWHHNRDILIELRREILNYLVKACEKIIERKKLIAKDGFHNPMDDAVISEMFNKDWKHRKLICTDQYRMDLPFTPNMINIKGFSYKDYDVFFEGFENFNGDFENYNLTF